MKTHCRRLLFLMAFLCLVFAGKQTAFASKTDADIKKANEKISDLEDKKEAAEDKLHDLAEQKNSLQGELKGLDQQLSNAAAKLNDLEVQITDKQTDIEVTGQQLEVARQIKEKQYEDMKLRISFMYKNGGSDMVSVLLSSESIADLLNKAEYIEAITRYDREMLDKYEQTCIEVAAEEARLEQEKTELLGMQEEMEQKKSEIDTLIANTQTSISNKQNQLSEAEKQVNDFESQIASMKALEEKLEAQKAKEDKARLADIKKQEKENTNNKTPVTSGAGDAAMLAALVECEAGGESYEGQLAVASVVVNRVRSAYFPNTVSGVIYQAGQFSPVASGRFALVLSRGAGGSCVQAANAALSGGTNVTSMYFRSSASGIEGNVIGNHVFY